MNLLVLARPPWRVLFIFFTKKPKAMTPKKSKKSKKGQAEKIKLPELVIKKSEVINPEHKEEDSYTWVG